MALVYSTIKSQSLNGEILPGSSSPAFPGQSGRGLWKKRNKSFSCATGREKCHGFQTLLRAFSAAHQNICFASCSPVTVWSGCLNSSLLEGFREQ